MYDIIVKYLRCSCWRQSQPCV